MLSYASSISTVGFTGNAAVADELATPSRNGLAERQPTGWSWSRHRKSVTDRGNKGTTRLGFASARSSYCVSLTDWFSSRIVEISAGEVAVRRQRGHARRCLMVTTVFDCFLMFPLSSPPDKVKVMVPVQDVSKLFELFKTSTIGSVANAEPDAAPTGCPLGEVENAKEMPR